MTTCAPPPTGRRTANFFAMALSLCVGPMWAYASSVASPDERIPEWAALFLSSYWLSRCEVLRCAWKGCVGCRDDGDVSGASPLDRRLLWARSPTVPHAQHSLAPSVWHTATHRLGLQSTDLVQVHPTAAVPCALPNGCMPGPSRRLLLCSVGCHLGLDRHGGASWRIVGGSSEGMRCVRWRRTGWSLRPPRDR